MTTATETRLTPAGAELVAAWLAWDEAAGLIGDRAREAIDRGLRPPRLTAGMLGREARRLGAAELAFGAPLGWTARVTALRWNRDGSHNLSAAKAVRRVVTELTTELG